MELDDRLDSSTSIITIYPRAINHHTTLFNVRCPESAYRDCVIPYAVISIECL